MASNMFNPIIEELGEQSPADPSANQNLFLFLTGSPRQSRLFFCYLHLSKEMLETAAPEGRFHRENDTAQEIS